MTVADARKRFKALPRLRFGDPEHVRLVAILEAAEKSKDEEINCAHCNGTGECECECGHVHSCADCGGSGLEDVEDRDVDELLKQVKA